MTMQRLLWERKNRSGDGCPAGFNRVTGKDLRGLGGDYVVRRVDEQIDPADDAAIAEAAAAAEAEGWPDEA